MADPLNRRFAGIAFRDASSPHSSILFRQEGAILPGLIVSCLRVIQDLSVSQDRAKAKPYATSGNECIANRWRASASSPVLDRCGV